MPIHEFTCAACGHSFEELVGTTGGVSIDKVTCPECGSTKAERQLSGVAPSALHSTAFQPRRPQKVGGTTNPFNPGARPVGSKAQTEPKQAGKQKKEGAGQSKGKG